MFKQSKKNTHNHPLIDEHLDNLAKQNDKIVEKYNKWLPELQRMSSNYNYNTSIGHLPSSTITSNTITSTHLADAKIRIDGGENGTMQVDVPLIVHGRDVMKELDELRESMLLITRDLKLEEHYPELKQAYDDYMELYRGIKIADKFANTSD